MTTFEEGEIVGFEFDGKHLQGRITFISGEGKNTEYMVEELNSTSRYSLYAEHLTKMEHLSKYVDPKRMVPIQSTTVTNHKPECDCGAKHTSFPNDHFGWCKLMSRT